MYVILVASYLKACNEKIMLAVCMQYYNYNLFLHLSVQQTTDQTSPFTGYMEPKLVSVFDNAMHDYVQLLTISYISTRSQVQFESFTYMYACMLMDDYRRKQKGGRDSKYYSNKTVDTEIASPISSVRSQESSLVSENSSIST